MKSRKMSIKVLAVVLGIIIVGTMTAFAAKAQVAPAVDREKLMEQYKEYGLEQDENGRWTMSGEEIHYLEDQATEILYTNSEGKVDVYVIRDEQNKLLRIDSYDYYRF